MVHAHVHEPRVPLRTAEARQLLAAAMDRCKVCRWAGNTSDEAIEDMYLQWARHRTISALADWRVLRGTLRLADVTSCNGHMYWPETGPAVERGWVTVTAGTRVSVTADATEAMSYIATLDHGQRARLVDDLLDGLVGAEFFPIEKAVEANVEL
ncbi:hypothetical protein RIF23_14785 [Lipingzhangella sp. LS1_29]|uniref:HNH endonuclease n=1 Tax=Lipingzhangella rawalii TaxID=2055835 RepID=A0ABU2H978_9ACTN|nr:hypothetical protein [Lipingzhangella rawalii]MDS1271562.1 hypothetical protein [Lipingzhangella rawalii]